jgi:hypothetical protein
MTRSLNRYEPEHKPQLAAFTPLLRLAVRARIPDKPLEPIFEMVLANRVDITHFSGV